MILLAFMLPWMLIHKRAYAATAGILAFGVVAVAAGDLWHMDIVLDRMNELTETHSSGHARFISGAWLIRDFLLEPRDLLFGLGPGAISEHIKLVAYLAHDATWAKLVFEYGLVGATAFGTLFAAAVYNRAPSRYVSAALTIGFLTFGGELLDPRLQALILLFSVLPKGTSRKGGPASVWAIGARRLT
jgi:hypothetical protein